MFTRTCAMLCLAALTASPATAATTNYFGHKVEVVDQEDQRALMVDGKPLATADHIFLEKWASLGGVDVIVATLHIGGVFCAPQTTLITFAKDKPPQTVAPADTDCREAKVNIGKDSIALTITPSPSKVGKTWTWAPATGLSATETIAFQPDPKKSWANVRSSKIENASSLFDFADIGAQLREAIGKDAEALELFDGPGSGEWKGDLFVASACMPHRCDEAGVLVVADAVNRRVHVAWKALDKKIVVRPVVAEWPRQARLELKAWAKPWTEKDETASANGIALVSASVSGGAAPSIAGPNFDPLRGLYKGEQGDALTHNGSWVWVFPRAGLIVYSRPKPSIADVVRPGDILLRGAIGRGAVRGTAYVFKSGCAPEPYAVTGNGYDGDPDARLVLRGAAPVRDRHSCAVLGASRSSGNATLVFQGQGEIGD